MSAEELVLIPREKYDLITREATEPVLTKHVAVQTDNVLPQPENNNEEERQSFNDVSEINKWLPTTCRAIIEQELTYTPGYHHH